MRGPSRAALTEARQRLSEAVTSAAEARTLGDELFAILQVLDEQAALRRALADSSRRADARAALAREPVRRPGQRCHPRPVREHV